MTQVPATDRKLPLTNAAGVLICSSAVETGSRVIASEEVDRAFGMPIGKLRGRAGIESLAYAADGENELTLGAKAAGEALRAAACGVQQLEWIIATSETHHSFPSLSAQLHSRLLAEGFAGAREAVRDSSLRSCSLTALRMTVRAQATG